MPDHERCAGCRGGEAYVCWPGLSEKVQCSCGCSAPSWEQWDRVMRAARELEQLLKLYAELRADYAEQTADARRMSAKLDRIGEVMDE